MAVIPHSLPAATSSRRVLADTLLLARMVAAFAILLAGHDGQAYLHHLLFVVGMALVTWGVRGVRWSTIYDAFLAGLLAAYGIVAVQWLIEMVLLHGASLTFRASVVAPLTEEPLKVAPLLVLLFALRWRGRWSSGACDLMVLGAALGSGFGFVEDSFWRKKTFARAVGVHLFGIPLTPDAHSSFIGHGGAAAFICLAIGWGVWMSRWKKLRVAAAVPALVVTFWMMVDHGLCNYSTFSMDRFTRWVWSLAGRGQRAPYALVAAGLLTLFAEMVVLLATSFRLRGVSWSRALAYVSSPLRRGFGYGELRLCARRLRGVLLSRLLRRQLGFLAAHRFGDAAIDRVRYNAQLLETTSRLIVAQEAVARS